MRRASTASRAIWRRAGLGRLREGDLSPVPGKFTSPITTTLDFPAGEEHAAPMFAGRLIRGVKNGPSPQWLQDWLKAVGLRPISALVDVTNFLSLDRGRPLHVFDAAKLKGNLRARFAKDGEQLLALDGKTYTLDSADGRDRRRRSRRAASAASWAARTHPAPRPRPTCSSNPRCSIRSASRAPAACSASSPMRAIASSAASIRNSCCRASNSRPR